MGRYDKIKVYDGSSWRTPSRIRAYYGGPNPYDYEYDQFLIRYVSEKFDLPLYLVNSYIKMYYFVDYFNHG